MDNTINKSQPSETVLLEEYKEAMESQRSLTNIVYSWTGSIFLILSTGMFYYGTKIDELRKLILVMALALVLVFIWWGIIETMIFYTRQRFQRIIEIEEILEMKLMSNALKDIKMLKWKSKFYEARNYFRFFMLSYLIVWIILIIYNF